MVTLAPILLLVFLFSLPPELNDSLPGECTDYLGGCFVSSDSAAPADSLPPEEFQEVGAYISENSSDLEPESKTPPEENIIEGFPEPGPEAAEQNKTGEFQDVDENLNETTPEEPPTQTTGEFMEVGEFLNGTPTEQNETGGFFSEEALLDLFSGNDLQATPNQTAES
ncbi:MAG: hypothetical protein QXH30_00360, partial [Candidatus Bilamarchaeaceae archaeon]